ITIYSMTMLIWGSRFQWTLASMLLYIGLTGWAIGGVGAVIDSIIPLNFRLHNTDWVVAHFHTYMILGVVVWGAAFLAHVLERDAGRSSSRAARSWTGGLLLVGGFGLTGTWFVAGALGIPRRYAANPSAPAATASSGRASHCCSRSASSPSSSNSRCSPTARASGAQACSWNPARTRLGATSQPSRATR
ncbi:MAG: cbb3-type cytochrome c oxidase subunit I, partial [Gaiellales bacterium]